MKNILVDDHHILRVGICSIPGNQLGMKIITEAVNGKDALQAAISLQPDLLLIDLLINRVKA